ncbi:hypothetical protein ID866_7803 [Astraeus odoratus]|nr:hypothetical protein ID866_7803 [Astraeus odoratus]
MVIPFMERGSAFDYVQDRVVDPRPLLKGIANGLSYLHSRSSVHGAIKGELFTRHPPFKDIQEAQGVLIKILQRPLNRPSNEATCYRMTDAWWKICSECIKMEALSRPQVSHVADKIGEMVQEK